MQFPHSIVAVFDSHDEADAAVKALAASGFAFRRLSVVGKGYHTSETATGFYTSGDRIRFWGSRGALWGSLWGLFMGGLYATVPMVGGVVLLGHLAAAGVSAIEGAVAFGGAGALAAGLASLGIPEESIIIYQAEVTADGFLVMAHGTAAEMERARATLETLTPRRITVHGANVDPGTPAEDAPAPAAAGDRTA
ncbi:general stress protein [Sphingomonas ginsenosidivorax]|uniref:general stress protein n=1 Tax=Sphingomonas ginsenosidivorax TaxID=862135 RepID=UPI0018F3CC54|nr:general stress protein [Sphingomonas ginsenosidivorax]